MIRFYELSRWLFTSLGIALLVCSLVLVPQGPVFGQGTMPGGQCIEQNCQNGCFVNGGFTACNTDGDVCLRVGNPTDCSACVCRFLEGELRCRCKL